jgi:hypothetical protein
VEPAVVDVVLELEVVVLGWVVLVVGPVVVVEPAVELVVEPAVVVVVAGGVAPSGAASGWIPLKTKLFCVKSAGSSPTQMEQG